jgi:hypothetical protein
LEKPIDKTNKNLEWKCDEVKEIAEEILEKRKRDYVNATKKEIIIWAYETIFNWLGIKFDKEHKEQFWKVIDYDRINDQEQLCEIRLIEILEYEMNGKRYKWRSKYSRRARRMRIVNFQSQLFSERKWKEFNDLRTNFLDVCIRRFQLSMSANLCYSWSRELTELLIYKICNGSQLRGTGTSRYSEDQIKYKVKKKLIKILPKHWELIINWFTG